MICLADFPSDSLDDLLVAGGEDHRIGGPFRLPGTQPQQIRIALAGSVDDPFCVPVADAVTTTSAGAGAVNKKTNKNGTRRAASDSMAADHSGRPRARALAKSLADIG